MQPLRTRRDYGEEEDIEERIASRLVKLAKSLMTKKDPQGNMKRRGLGNRHR